jgi:DNA-binding response OmpR family regulator
MVNRHFQVIIADDDRDDHFFLEQALKLSGFSSDITSMYSGTELLQYLDDCLKHNPKAFALPDVIILDINMPNMNGIETLTEIKLNEILKNIPVFMLSTSRGDNEYTTSMKLGARGFFTKPGNINELKCIVENVFSSLLQSAQPVGSV